MPTLTVLSGEKNPREWIIYSKGGGMGWFAWNGLACKRIDLVGVGGTFSDAVDAFEKKIGAYYESR